MPRILVTGGAGYIGAVTTAGLAAAGYDVTVVDNLSTGHRAALSAELIEADLCNENALDEIFSAKRYDGVLHFASRALVEESVTNPRRYFGENVANGLKLFAAMLDHGVRALVLSSSAAIYGNPQSVPIPEDHPGQPVNPYGESKLFLERVLGAYGNAYGLESVCLRYFNACGGSLDGRFGESHGPETHLIPLVLRAAADTGFELTVYGDDYQTPDGTCVRDYIHVEDLASAHILALRWLLDGRGSRTFNLGTGQGLSIHQMVTAAERITQRKVRRRLGARRAGDPAILVADAARAHRELGWVPRHSDVDTILRTAWNWVQNPRY